MTGSKNWYIGFESFVERVAHYVSIVGQLFLMAMVALTVVDVILRRLFNKPLSAGLEMSQVLLVVVVFTSVVYCGIKKGHVSIDVLISRLPEKVQKIVDCFTCFLGASLFLVMGWASFVLALDKLEIRCVNGILPFPVCMGVLVVSVCSFLLSVILLLRCIRTIVQMVDQ